MDSLMWTQYILPPYRMPCMAAQVLSQHTGKRPINLFVSRQATAFSDATFSQYWTMVMSKVDTRGQEHFPPSKARTMYVERITADTGLPPDMWDGVAAVMDNTTRQVRACLLVT